MPVLKEYADSNEKDGYYVHAYVYGMGHPLPLQTPEVTEKIYRELGYKPLKPGDDGGVNVPKHLTWTLYEVGLHWTGKSGPQEDASELNFDDFRDAAGPTLSETDIKTIRDFTEDYSGQYSSHIKELRGEFTEDPTVESDGEATPSLKELIQEESAAVSFNDEVELLLEDWQPDRVKPDDYEPEEAEGFLTQFYTTRSEYRKGLDFIPELNTKFEEYSNHSWEVDSVKGVKFDTESDSRGLKLVFQPNSDSKINEWVVIDYRGTNDARDFRIAAGISSRSYSFNISDNYISDFEITVTHEHVGKFDLPPDDFWGYEVENQDPNEIMHTLLSDCSHLIPIIADFFDGIPSYRLESTDPANHSIYLP
ncbi:hypothetical protein [Halorubrum sp. Ea1]|uniref:hypothetical protein n=1 Tax=Halorubrum sp. Ea1 TaxID=1480718 RepID=UPI0011407370|nr:hypothetical protein [Halorubrum sp. Ea1]